MSLHHHRPIQLLLLLLISTVHSQPTTNSDQQPLSGFSKGFNPATAIVIVAIMSAFFFMGFFYIYFHKRSSGSSERRSHSIETMLESREQATKGLDPTVIDSFPTTIYSNVKGMKMGGTTLECAVCISEFADHETLTLLPKCNHAFHPDCIGTWLSSHTTCPVCRTNLAAVSSTSSPDHDSPPEHVTVTVEDDIAEELRRMGSKRGRVLRTWRSRSERPGAGARMGQFWAEEERERFTLRLPENVRRELLTGVKPFPLTSVRVESSRMGYRGEDVGLRKWDRAAKSDRWAFLGRASSVRSSSKGGDMEGGGSSRGKVLAAVMGPLDCIGGGGGGVVDDDKSTVALMKT